MFGYTLIKTYELNKLKRQAEGNNYVAYAKGYQAGRSAGEEWYRTKMKETGGQISMFDDFDIDYNQYKYLKGTTW